MKLAEAFHGAGRYWCLLRDHIQEMERTLPPDREILISIAGFPHFRVYGIGYQDHDLITFHGLNTPSDENPGDYSGGVVIQHVHNLNVRLMAAPIRKGLDRRPITFTDADNI